MAGLGTNPLAPLAILAAIRGDYVEAIEKGNAIHADGEVRADKQNLAFAHYILTTGCAGLGQFEAARQHAQQACDIARSTNERWFLAYCLNEWGNVDRALADYTEAKQHYRASYTIREEFDDPEGMAVALTHLGSVAILQADYAEARQLYQRSYDLYRDINDRGGLATALNGLGLAACALGDFQAASDYFHQALQITTEVHFTTLTLVILIGVAELFWHNDQYERAIELLAFVHYHPAGERETRDKAKQFLDNYEQELTPDIFASACHRGESENLDSVISTVQTQLATLEVWSTKDSQEATATSSPQPDMSGLIEPLTPRELEVLQHISEGLTNQQIAEELIISVGTVKSYTSQIYGKLLVNNRTQAVAKARELGLLA
jgi:ATP/maltotriose-dependent transcriptional regulator MalT